MKKYKFDLWNGLMWTVGIGLGCVGLDAILALYVSLVGGLLLSAGVAVSAPIVLMIGILLVLLTAVLYSFSKEN